MNYYNGEEGVFMGSVREEIAKNLLFYRKKNKLTQKQLAEILGIKSSAVSNWENGLNSIDIEKLFFACKVLKITPNDVYGIYAEQKTELPPKDDGIALYEQLDDIDKANVKGYMRGMLQAEKYKQDDVELA